MSNYTINNTSQTVGTITACFIATALLLNVQTHPAKAEALLNIKGSTYYSSVTPSTFDQFSNIYSGEYMPNLDPFVGAMSNIYASLLTHQERLEPEFEAVLNENLWDLYES
jgi:hypothetical protein